MFNEMLRHTPSLKRYLPSKGLVTFGAPRTHQDGSCGNTGVAGTRYFHEEDPVTSNAYGYFSGLKHIPASNSYRVFVDWYCAGWEPSYPKLRCSGCSGCSGCSWRGCSGCSGCSGCWIQWIRNGYVCFGTWKHRGTHVATESCSLGSNCGGGGLVSNFLSFPSCAYGAVDEHLGYGSRVPSSAYP